MYICTWLLGSRRDVKKNINIVRIQRVYIYIYI